jgi:hypothetical protein
VQDFYPKPILLLGKDRHDDYNVAGYGTSLKAGLDITFFKHFYIQGELKGGYINMQTSELQTEERSASQDFSFNVLFLEENSGFNFF